MKQKEIFMQGEGDAWFTRNAGSLGLRDPVTDAINDLKINPDYVLEIGCSDGWRLARLRNQFGCGILGVEPSMKAAMAAAQRKVPVHQMTASTLPVNDNGFDLVIYGFCLYLTDPNDWFNIAAEGHRALRTGGHLIIHDFGESDEPFASRYEHDPRLLSYHFPFSKLWRWHPGYSWIATRTDPDRDEQVTVLRKREYMKVTRP